MQVWGAVNVEISKMGLVNIVTNPVSSTGLK